MTALNLAHTALRAAVSLALLFAVCPSTNAQPPLTPKDAALHETYLTSPYGIPGTIGVTSYGPPVFVAAIKNTSIDHFGAAQYVRNETYNMQYRLVWPKNKPNTSSAIYLFCGQEIPIEETNTGSGFYSALANDTGALQVWPEHRYYATQAPFLPGDNFGHSTIEQALVDHVELVLYIQNLYNLSTSPVIAIGSSYSANLASYLRIRYPDVIAGAICSSSVSFSAYGLDPGYDPYASSKIATRAASSEGGSAAACPANVQKFFKTLLSSGSHAPGLRLINSAMRLCPGSTVASQDDVLDLAARIKTAWRGAAQFNCPAGDPTIGAPAYPVRVACNYFKQTNLSTTDLLGNMVSALAVFGQRSSVDRSVSTPDGCLRSTDLKFYTVQYEPPITAKSPSVSTPTVSVAAAAPGPEPVATPEPTGSVNCGDEGFSQNIWADGSDGVTDMFYQSLPPSTNINWGEKCGNKYLQYNWAAFNFGLSAVRRSSNIFYTRSFYDPLSAYSPAINISATIISAIHEGCHGWDLGDTDPADPPSVTAVRQQGAALIAQWVKKHNTMKTQLPMSNAANVFDLSYSLGGYTNPQEGINDTLPGSNNVRNQLQWYDSMSSSASNSNPINFTICCD